MLCRFCDELSISGLIELAEIEFSSDNFPRAAYYQHHASYADLVSSANGGCELCELIHQAFIETVIEGGYWDEYTLDAAVHGIESERLSTDLKICINTSHLYSGEALQRVKLFDTILIQAGIHQPYGDEVTYEEVSRDWSISDPLSFLSLELSVPRGKSRFVSNFEVGRYHTDPDLGSSQNHEIAKDWLKTCCRLHREETESAQVSMLPTRVIDVGELNGSQNPKLFLSENTEGHYAALSHCWGGVISPLLMTENLEPFQRSIPYGDLPANFRDAITITRQLGIQYLWIDSLCIIQNSRLDWEIESKKMGFIYRDALLTISASTSPGSKYGIFKSNSPSNQNEKKVTLKLYKNSKLSDIVCISKRPKKPENLYHLFLKSPLSQRGWTLQEGLLSPRILYYGERQIYWKCPHGFQSADGMPSMEGGSIMPPDTETFPNLTSILYQPLSNHSNSRALQTDMVLKDYYWLVITYSSRKLTFESDKLPAFSGVVELLHPTIGGDYIAGLWSRDLAQGLSWYPELGVCKHVESYRSPSWSWAVTDDPIRFYTFDGKATFSEAHDVKLVSWNVSLKTESVYGQIESCQLTLRGWTKDLVRSSQEVNAPWEEFAASTYYDEQDGELGNHAIGSILNVSSENGDYFLSTIDGQGPKQSADGMDIDYDKFSGSEHTIILLRSLLDDDEVMTLVGLALLKLDGDDTRYERAGFVTFHPMASDEFESWIASWTEQTITLI